VATRMMFLKSMMGLAEMLEVTFCVNNVRERVFWVSCLWETKLATFCERRLAYLYV
jgi:hypothetical protein